MKAKDFEELKASEGGELLSDDRLKLLEHWRIMRFGYCAGLRMFDAQWSDGYMSPPAGEPYSTKEVISWLNEIPRMAQEILDLRKQNKALLEDGERLANNLANMLLAEHDGDADWVSGNDALKQHKALMERIEKEI